MGLSLAWKTPLCTQVFMLMIAQPNQIRPPRPFHVSKTKTNQ